MGVRVRCVRIYDLFLFVSLVFRSRSIPLDFDIHLENRNENKTQHGGYASRRDVRGRGMQRRIFQFDNPRIHISRALTILLLLLR